MHGVTAIGYGVIPGGEMMSERALLKAVLAAPDDDLPRLVLADWLDEHGQAERAGFIRSQIAEANGVETEGFQRSKYALYSLSDQLVHPVRRPWSGLLVGDDTIEVHHDGRTYVHFTFRRGFVAEVRCDLRTWVGGECGQCSVRGEIVDREFWLGEAGPCPGCPGTGRTPGIGPQVVAEHPVTTVTLVDREPWQHSATNGPYSWWPDDHFAAEHSEQIRAIALPVELFGLLDGYIRDEHWWTERRFTTREAALAALSDAAILWAREQAARLDPAPG